MQCLNHGVPQRTLGRIEQLKLRSGESLVLLQLIPVERLEDSSIPKGTRLLSCLTQDGKTLRYQQLGPCHTFCHLPVPAEPVLANDGDPFLHASIASGLESLLLYLRSQVYSTLQNLLAGLPLDVIE